MRFFVEKNTVLNEATDTNMARVKVPGMDTSLAAVSDLRQQNRETGSQGWMYDKQWRHVASIRGPVLQVAELLDPHFLNRNGKRDFYAWLDNHLEYCTYDRRRGARTGNSMTFMDGLPV